MNLARSVLTVQDLEAAGAGGEVVVRRGRIITPLTRDEGERRGIAIRFEEPKASALAEGREPQRVLRREL